ncbi:hypothetical protein QYF36_024721 [Acer negundo]|nr:hypothetical protein QYF36_024721 [Acer negundo]
MKVAVDENDLKAVGAQPLPVGRRGLRIHDWEVKSHKGGRRSWTRRICRRWKVCRPLKFLQPRNGNLEGFSGT